MQVIGFTFTKISGEKKENFTSSVKNINLGFKNITEEKIEMLKDEKAIKITFTYSVKYNEPTKDKEKKEGKLLGEISIHGEIILMLTKEESKEILKNWEDKKISQDLQIHLYNIIFKKTTPKVVYLADEINLPSPVPIQKIQKQ